jgi:gliding motility-associated-like protein
VEELRNGTVIAIQRKDIQIAIAPCTVAEAKLQEAYMLCGNTKTITLSNLSTSPLINSQSWQLVHRNGTVLYASKDPVVTYTFADTGTYFIRLAINSGQECSDSTNAIVRVYPGFVPDFQFAGVCFNKPTRFTNLTTSVYGQVNSWSWDFGEFGFAGSSSADPQYTFKSVGNKLVKLITGNSVGCLDTIEHLVTIAEKPPLTLTFRDTLICLNDNVQLKASGKGVFQWSPARNIVNLTTSSPTVRPTATTMYYVDLDDDGCLNRDSVRVRVTTRVNLQVMNDTTICQGDPVQLRVQSDGFTYSWTPVSQVQDARQKTPVAVTQANTVYQVTAFIGSCEARASIRVNTVPYPLVNAGMDTMICFSTPANLRAVINGNSVKWLPETGLTNATALNTIARPAATTAYVCYATDNKGCPKPGTDTVIVTVLPDIHAFAGRDTSVVTGQSLQLNGSGGVRYEWSPATGLSAVRIANPVALYQQPEGGIRYRLLVYNEAGCVDSAFMRVKVFKTQPAVFVPNAFTPNGDGINDMLRPLAAGLKSIEYFNIYNRWGQLVFSGSATSQGWDGSMGGKLQASGSYVWMVKATDYTGGAYVQKGTVTLLR